MENPGSPNNQAAAPTAVESERTPPPPPSTASALSWLGRSAARRIIPQKLIDWFGETDAAHNAGVVVSEEQPAGDSPARDAGPPAHEDSSAMASAGPSYRGIRSTHRAPNNSSNADNIPTYALDTVAAEKKVAEKKFKQLPSAVFGLKIPIRAAEAAEVWWLTLRFTMVSMVRML